MRKITSTLILLLLLLSASPEVFSQAAAKPKATKTKMAPVTGQQLVLQNGRMVTRKDGQSIPLEKELMLTNGTKLQPDGTLVLKNGKQEKLREGEAVGMDGTITPVAGSDQALLSFQNNLAAIEEQFDLVMADSELQKDQLTRLSERLTILNEKMLLLNEKVALLQKAESKKARKAATSELDRIEQQLHQLNTRLKELEK